MYIEFDLEGEVITEWLSHYIYNAVFEFYEWNPKVSLKLQA